MYVCKYRLSLSSFSLYKDAPGNLARSLCLGGKQFESLQWCLVSRLENLFAFPESSLLKFLYS